LTVEFQTIRDRQVWWVHNPIEWLEVYQLTIEATGEDSYVMTNYLPIFLSSPVESSQFADSTGQGSHDSHLWVHWFCNLSRVALREVADKGGEVGLVILTVKSLFMSALERWFQGKIEEITVLAGLDVNTTNDLSLGSTRLIFQEEIMFEEREVWMVDGWRFEE
jgi:hypothetical protein